MEYEAETIKGFDAYCQEKRKKIAEITDEEQKARQEKVLVARSLLCHESEQMIAAYTRYITLVEGKEDSDTEQFWNMQEALVDVICAGLEDTAFQKWKANLIDAIRQVQATEQIKRLPRFAKACGGILDSLDIDFSDIEEELKMIFEPECIYNTIVLLVTVVKNYCEFLDRMCERQKSRFRKGV